MNQQKFSAAFSGELFSTLADRFAENENLLISGAGNHSAKSLLLDRLLANSDRPVLWIVADEGEAKSFIGHLEAWQTRPITRLAAENSEEERERSLELLREIDAIANSRGVLVTTTAEVQKKFPDPAALAKSALKITRGETISRTNFFNDLISAGYENDEEPAPGSYHASGSTIAIHPPDGGEKITLDFDGETIEEIWVGEEKQKEISLLPISSEFETADLLDVLPTETLIVADEIIEEEGDELEEISFGNWFAVAREKFQTIAFTSFPETDDFIHLRNLSVLKFVTPRDLIDDLRTKKDGGWHVIAATKQADELRGILNEYNFVHAEGVENAAAGITIVELTEDEFSPQAFQNPAEKIAFVTDREMFGFQRGGKAVSEQKVYLDFISSLRSGDFVVHLDHGIGIFRGIEQQTVDDVTREYLRIDYAAGDKLFVPIDQADKVNRYIGTGDTAPRLTRLGSSEWATVQKRVAAETEKIAKEMLDLFARRAAAVGHKFEGEGDKQKAFEEGFPYEETPGQIRAIADVKADMEAEKPMDRLVCGDVGFGKTEVAMRAAFKAAMAGKQVAFISPITILTDQHFKSFEKRLAGFDVSIEMLSRFKTPSEQKKILAGLADGSVQIVIGTHRLLQPDVKFKDLGLVIIDEEQRFGVGQKEKLKELRNRVDLLTMTATPIPRTLNMALNKLRDITTITTPPPGRLPIVTEVRHFSWKLIEDSIRHELARNGQAYFLHNRVATIEGIAEKLRSLVPEARFVVTHGQLPPDELEKRIIAFKNGEYDVLISSTIIENGIDLPKANTLIVNDSENFGLSQLYQLRGRVGRSRTQAYAYFLYGTRHLKLDAKKRLRAIVEASELGSGFDIAMKDLEIRGAGNILGTSQSGTINTIGVSHFVRLLNQAVEDMKSGKTDDEKSDDESATADISLELPFSAFIPVDYISDTKEKIRVYQRLSSVDSKEDLAHERHELVEEFGKPPIEVVNLLKVLRLKLACRQAGVTAVRIRRIGSRVREATLSLGKRVKPANIMNALATEKAWQISGENLKANLDELGVDWFKTVEKTVEALATEFRNDDVKSEKN